MWAQSWAPRPSQPSWCLLFDIGGTSIPNAMETLCDMVWEANIQYARRLRGQESELVKLL